MNAVSLNDILYLADIGWRVRIDDKDNKFRIRARPDRAEADNLAVTLDEFDRKLVQGGFGENSMQTELRFERHHDRRFALSGLYPKPD